MSEETAFTARVVADLKDTPAEAWDRCAGDANPFTRHAFLLALQESGSATADTGWLGQHILIEGDDNQIIAAAPMYLKSHSQGEYVFDHGWANAWEQAGGRYYPKLQGSVPFTPVTGPRLMTPEGPGDKILKQRLAIAGAALADKLDVSSAHMTFVEEADAAILADAGYLIRNDQQFHWQNDGYETFDAFLAALSSRKRKTIKRERREAVKSDIEIQMLTGSDITESHWDDFFAFYVDTGMRKWGPPYLTREFFSMVGASMPESILLIVAQREGRYIAGALNFIGGDTLYGRYWGAVEHHPFLHFELAYYRAIDFAIERGLGRIEAGAQGEHKLARGYLPSKTYSAHWIRDAGFRGAVENFLADERRAIEQGIEYLGDFTPFKRGVSGLRPQFGAVLVPLVRFPQEFEQGWMQIVGILQHRSQLCHAVCGANPVKQRFSVRSEQIRIAGAAKLGQCRQDVIQEHRLKCALMAREKTGDGRALL